MQSGSGLSGSTHWNNSVRSRLYLTKAGGENGDRDERVLEVMKNNRGPLGKRLALRWSTGAFVLSVGPAEGVTEADVDALFIDMLSQYAEQGRYVNAAGGPTFAPSAFAKDEGVRWQRVSKKALTDAMYRLLRSKRTGVPTRKVRGHDRTYLSVVPAS
ncbi:MAG: hypothetical protein EOP84_19790 [Verrucomicrobiaceae bacterium]|nr:MAG: hypothetical protein EOP84_19790 [Verrucomicrobiaceae bacterium]